MKVRVLLFARARDLAQSEAVTLELPEFATVNALLDELSRAVPSLVPLVPHLFVAVNEEYAPRDAVIPPSATVACFPPVSGG